MTPNLTKKLLMFGTLLLGLMGFSQEYNSFEVRYQNNIKGDLTFISNQIVNRDGGTATTEPVDGYNNLSTNNNNNPETGGRQNYNDYKQMQYIDVDGNTDLTTFNSSSYVHTPTFQPDEEALRVGVRAASALLLGALQPR